LAGVTIDPTPTIDPYTQEAILALNSEACIKAPYPTVIRATDLNAQIDRTFALVESLVYTIRNIRGEMKIPPGTAVEVHIVAPSNHPDRQNVIDNQKILPALVKINGLHIHETEPTTLGHASVGSVEGLKIMIPIPTNMLQQEKARLVKEKERLTLTIEKFTVQLSNENFVSNAPPELIAKQRALLEQAEKDLERITQSGI